jgi:benzoylformate decarboxylase
MSDVNFPMSHQQYLGDFDPASPSAKDLFNHMDVLVGIGCPLFTQGFFNPVPILPRNLRVIQIDENPWEIGKNFPADCGIQADIKEALAELNDMIERQMSSNEGEEARIRAKEIAKEKARLKDQFKVQVENERDRSPISISRLMTEIRDAMPRDGVVVDE